MITITSKNSKGIVSLAVIMIASQICLGIPSKLVAFFPSGAYIPLLLTGVFVVVYCKIMDKFLKGNSVGEAAGQIFGRTFVKFIDLAFAFWSVIYASFVMKSFSHAIGEVVLPLSPEVFVLGIAALVALVVCFVGFEALNRYSFAFCIAACLGVCVIFVVSLHEAEPGNLFPLLSRLNANGIKECFGLYVGVLFCFFAPCISSRKYKHVYLPATIIAGVFMSLVVFFYTLCIPFPASQKYVYPLHRISLLANSTLVFQRLDFIVYVLWVFISFLTSGASLLFAGKLVSRALELKDCKGVAPALVFVCFIMSLSGTVTQSLVIVPAEIFFFAVMPFVAIIYHIKMRRSKVK